ncbi:S-ribosylhomocysteine lyase, partial [Xanthomonas citri pv. citri]|nr:S-ribosylhomocysteine lyase [Xanthomonas citri pv. citri]
EGPIPGATPRDCGNYTFMDHQGARLIARKYLDEVLADPTDANFTYPAE